MKRTLLLVLGLLFIAGMVYATDYTKEEITAATWAYEQGQQLSQDQVAILKDLKLYEGANGPVIDYAGGPDAFGYVYKDSEEPDGPVYNFVDISATGTAINAGMTDDNAVGPYPIGFTFNFYGVGYTQFWVGSNGVLCLGDPAGYFTYSNTALPYTGTTIPTIFWCWDDFYVPGGGSVYYETLTVEGQNALVMMYDNVAHYSGVGSGTATGEVILFQDGTFRTQYEEFVAPWPADTQTIGIQNPGHTISLQADFNLTPPNYPYAGLAIEFSNAVVADANLSGLIYDMDTEDPIDGAEVTLGGDTYVTGPDGMYYFWDLYPLPVNVTAHKAGYFDGAGSIELVSGDNVLDIGMAAMPPIYFQTDFEGGPEPFSTPGPAWQFGTPTIDPVGAFSGVNAWSIYLDGDYLDSENEWLISTQSWIVNNPGAFFSYMAWYEYESHWDGYNVQVSMDGGLTWSVLVPESGYNDQAVVGLGQPGFTGVNNVWHMETVQLGAYMGMEIMLAFRHGTDSSVHGYSGATVDDFTIAGVTQPQPAPFEVILSPYTETIPSEGGPVCFDVLVRNNTQTGHTGMIWADIFCPNNTYFGPFGFQCNFWEPGEYFFPQVCITIPGWAQDGEYQFNVYLGGVQQGFVAAMDHFQFYKGTPAGDGMPVNNWNFSGFELAGSAADQVNLPDKFELAQVYPNPFNPTANVSVALPEASDLTVTVFNLMGQQVAKLVSGKVEAGVHNFVLDGSNLASGVYFVQAVVPGQLNAIQKVTLMK